MMRSLHRLFISHTVWFSGLLGAFLAVLMVFFYGFGLLQRFDDAVYDSLMRLAGPQKKHPDIALIGINDKTLAKFGWPIPRQYYHQLIDKLYQAGARAIGFNIMLSTWQRNESDQRLAHTLRQSEKVVLPVFYDYSTHTLARPHDFFQHSVATLGNVAVYPGAVTRYIDSQVFNLLSKPQKHYLPMGVELARLYLGLSSEQIIPTTSALHMGPSWQFPLEKGGLLRIPYQGPPGYFTHIPFEDVLSGTNLSYFRNKLVLIGAFAPGLGDVTDSPYSDEVTSPMYGTEIQAHISQSILNRTPLYYVPQWILIILTLTLGILGGYFLYFRPFAEQCLILLGTILASLLIAAFLFSFFSLVVDIAPIICLCLLMSFALLILTVIKSSLMLNQEFKALGQQEAELPQMPLQIKIHHTLITLYHTNQAQWFCFRRCEAETHQLVLQDSIGVTGSNVLPVQTYSESLLNQLPQTTIPIESVFVPEEIRGGRKDGFYLFAPIYLNNHLFGVFEGYYRLNSDFENSSFELIQDLQRFIGLEMAALLQSAEKRPLSGLTRGVENKIAALSRLNKRFHDYNAFLVTTLKGLNHPLVACNPLGEILFFNEQFLHILSLDGNQDIVQQSVIDLLERSFSFRQKDWHHLWNTAVHHREQANIQLQNHRSVYLLALTPVASIHYHINGVVMVFTDITTLHQQANYDMLTQLCNRRYFDELLEREYNRMKRHPELRYSVLMLDIDHFKSLNDTYGHHTGDEVLSRVGQCVSQNIRKTDIAGRYGGEEMVLLLPSTSMQGASTLAEKIRLAISRIDISDLTQVSDSQVTVSMGVAMCDLSDASYDLVVRRADEAMYCSKESGRNCTHVHLGGTTIQWVTPEQKV